MDILKDLFKYEKYTTVCGLCDELQILYYYHYFMSNDQNVLIVTNSLYDANKIFQKLQTYTDDVCLFPMDDFLASVALAISPDLKVKRLEALEKLKTKRQIVVTNLMGYLRFLPAVDVTKKLKFTLTKDTSINRDEILQNLDYYGYKRETIVTTTGEYAIRGYIIDIFPIESDHPVRIELFGDEIESLRFFNENTQLSINEIEKLNILPFDEISSESHSSLYDYMEEPMAFIVDEGQLKNGYDKLVKEMNDYRASKELPDNYAFMYDYDDIEISSFIKIETIKNLPDAKMYYSKPIIKFNGNYDSLVEYCLKNKDLKYVVICLSNETQQERLAKLFDHVNIGSIVPKNVNIIKKKINEGFAINDYIFISEYDIDDSKIISNYHNTFKMGRKVKDFNDLHVGDYVVHATHGIGIYGGIVALDKNGLMRDYIMINYLDNDKVYIPVEKISTIYKYSDADGTRPQINRLNSVSWAKTKMRVKNKIHDISQELIKLYAARSNSKGPIFKDFPEEEIFKSNFGYTETSDQTKCIYEINEDLKQAIPMDRLLCGDVGFGKTEVAFRAMFKTVMNGFQVAYLCPTTLLSRQQYLSALDRFKDFPINIALLNRFVAPSEVTRIINGLLDGSIDIVFGTHKLLNKAIDYKNLGLLVIDEEQRFGVTHKEKIKELKNDVNVLTLSATPIPRTLKMAMSGLRDLSLIDTPPVNRYPVQTYVLEENDVLIKDAIVKELSRGGQVFILYNQVQSIVDEMTKIKMLVPEARVVIAHGQMEKHELERVVSAFIDNQYDILICTTIIETGIDIPNVNTLIVLDADKFGLSQLYQLRGRVGRSDKIAYAYLMYKPAKLLTDTAVKRLQSIKDFTELGSGYKIAMRDLSIRGAGDLLGSEQAGFVDSVGLQLYTQMVNDEIKRLNGEEVEEDTASKPLIEVANHIDDTYVSEESLKIEIHKMINEITDAESLDKIKAEISDRFGQISDDMEIYMYQEWFEKLALKLNITNVHQTKENIEIELPEDVSNKLDGEKLFLIVYNINPQFRLRYYMKKISFTLPLKKLDKHFVYYLIPLLNKIIDMIK